MSDELHIATVTEWDVAMVKAAVARGVVYIGFDASAYDEEEDVD